MAGVSPGFFGKLPSRGDFVGRRLAPDFVDAWDTWLQSAIATSRATLGAEWLDVYLTSPLWRFALSPGVCGTASYVGVVMPSVDNVGRYFPLAAALPCGARGAAWVEAAEQGGWFDAVEALLLETLAEAPLALDAFDEHLSQLVLEWTTSSDESMPARREPSRPPTVQRHLRHLSLAAPGASGHGLLDVCADMLESSAGPHSFWWTQGSQRMSPCVLVASQLPEPSAYVAMLDGRFAERGWSSGEQRAARLPRAARRAAYLASRAAAVTHVGNVRSINEDSFACRDDIGMWLVADGLGGHQSGDAASRMVAAALRSVDGGLPPTARVDALCAALEVVNACLRELTAGRPDDVLIASTVVALAVGECSAVCVWAGDSRLYRLRHRSLEQLSDDHGAADEQSPDSRFVTRAVGGSAALQLETRTFDVQDGDRYLLCTDGLYAEVPSERIVAALALPEPAAACEQLQQEALRGAARDNLTAIVVHVSAQGTPAGAEAARW